MSNQIAAIVSVVGVFYMAITMWSTPEIAYLPLILIISSIFTILLNYLNFYQFSRFLLTLVIAAVISLFHANLVKPGDSLIIGLFLAQLVVTALPWIYIDLREKGLIVACVLISWLFFLSQPWLDNHINTGIQGSFFVGDLFFWFSLMVALAGLPICLFLAQSRNIRAEGANAKLIDDINQKNAEMELQQKELQKSLEEVNKSRQEDDKRNWIASGISEIGNLLRGDMNEQLFQHLISRIVEFMKVTQGGIYTVEEDTSHEKFLKLQACYAYDRLKFIEQRIEIDQGLVGQCYLEEEEIYMTDVPEDYVHITSGLGGANPSVILIVPLKEEDRIEGIIEIASFKPLQPHERQFLQQFGENIASFIASYRTNQRTKQLLEQSQQQSEELRAQEEEMRQNMEELQATQEEMARKEKETNKLLEISRAKENELSERITEIEAIKQDLELEHSMFTGLMDLLSDRITIKDRNGRYLRVNKTKADSFKKQGFFEIEGKSDVDFYGEEHDKKGYQEEKRIMETGNAVLNKEDKIVMPNGNVIWGSTSRAPFRDHRGEVLGILVVTRDVTVEKNCQEQLEETGKTLESLKKQGSKA